MIEKAESKGNSVFALHCHVAAISDSRYSKDSKVKAYQDLCGDYHTRVRVLFNREDSKLSWLLTACHLPCVSQRSRYCEPDQEFRIPGLCMLFGIGKIFSRISKLTHIPRNPEDRKTLYP
jgi:hypothetical protein